MHDISVTIQECTQLAQIHLFIHGAGERVVSVHYCVEPTDYLIGRGKASGDEKRTLDNIKNSSSELHGLLKLADTQTLL